MSPRAQLDARKTYYQTDDILGMLGDLAITLPFKRGTTHLALPLIE